ncbi:MAG: PSD1 and planctomycete cytochrome C domain-containing protein [Verrucomicrobiales bacterium]|nr:PSD1 and planctomycete cytochrome C domain-containing protein [Verrucomicrobiales bacterium]
MKTASILLVPILLSSVVSLPRSLEAQPDGEMSGTEFFERRVRPLLVKHCYECHSEAEGSQKGGLLLDRESGWLDGGDTGKAVVPGNLGDSLLITAVGYADPDFEMPPKYQLEAHEVKIFEKWVRDGAAGPAEDMGETEFSQLGDQEVIFGKAKDHWSFQPMKKVTPPKTADPAWDENPIDQFVFAKLKEKGMTPSPTADHRTLIRRLSYKLNGLPPTKEEIATKDLNAYIDTLLESPRFGEHVGRYWLDVARYADTAITYRADTKTPHYYPYAFTYRDYVIDAFNHDKPFDLFVKEQLAADLLGSKEGDPTLAALGFIAVSPYRNMSHDFVDDVIDVTTRGILGMTVSCSRCHDHKFEPIPTADYYSLYGVFNSVNRPEPWKLDEFPIIKGYGRSPEEVADYQKLKTEIDQKIKKAGDSVKKGNNRSIREEIEQTDLAELLLFHEGGPIRAMSVSEKAKPTEPAIFIRGEVSSKGDRVPRRFLKIIDPEQKPFNPKNSGRLDLAGKMVDPENPLTARVYVNRIWAMLMGDPIVDTPSDFGLQGEAPSHPELLDFLALKFIEDGWSTKKLVRFIVTSKTFQQAGLNREEMVAIDPENEFLWRANRTRLRIEEIRDSLLAVGGQLDTRMRGRPGQIWGEEYTKRRSVYGYVNRFNIDPTLRNFDFPSPVQTQGSRTENIVSPQALFLMNSPFMVEQAASLISAVSLGEIDDRGERIEIIFARALQRSPTPGEIEKVERFMEIEESRDVDPWPLLAQSLLMSNEFLYVD